MIFTNTISLLLALAPATLFAAPTQVVDSISQLIPRADLPKAVVDELVKTNGLCDLSKVELPVGMSSLHYFHLSMTLILTIAQHPHLSQPSAKAQHSNTLPLAAARKTTPVPPRPPTPYPSPTAQSPPSLTQHVTPRASTAASWPTSPLSR
jgi:hypothetical protein